MINAWQGRGFSLRQVMTEALLKLNLEFGLEVDEQMIQINEKLDQLSRFLGSMNKNQSVNDDDGQGDSSVQKLSQKFVASMKITAKPGLRVS